MHLTDTGLKLCDRLLDRMSPDVNEIPPDTFDELERYYPDSGKSCIMANKIVSKEYDLQVIMPVYNTAHTVQAAVESVLCQMGGPDRILLTIINDGSPDNAREVLAQYEGRRDVEIIDQENRGLSGARNTGLKRLRARYVTFLDSDDRLVPYGLHKLLAAARKYDADVVQGGFYRMETTGEVKNTWMPENRAANGAMDGFPWGKVFRSELFATVGFPEGYWFEDTLLAAIIFSMARVKASASVPVYQYIINHMGITYNAKKSKKILDTLWVTKRLYADRQLMGMECSGGDYANFLHQTRINHRRIFRLAGNRLSRKVFDAHRFIRREYLNNGAGQEVSHPVLARTDRALASNSYKVFRFLNGLR